MKKIILLVFILFAVVKYISYNNPVDTNIEPTQLEYKSDKWIEESSIDTGFKNKPKKRITSSATNYKCDGRQYCSQMTSCEEATFFINNCPNTKMDGNNDGVPCERQWCN